MKIKKKIINAALSLLAACLLLPGNALAAGSVDTGRAAELTIRYHDGENALSGAAFDIYRIAAVEETGELTAVAPFDEFNVDIRGKNDEAWKTLASTLEGYVLRDNIAPYDSGKTDENGTLVFPAQKEKLETGLYLVLGQRHTKDGMIYDAASFMAMLPTVNKKTNEWRYELTVEPKHEARPAPVETVRRQVLKLWEDEGYGNVRPKEITVELLKDGEVYDAVKLNAKNNWRHTWEKLDDKAKWTVVEKEVEGYEVTVAQEGVTFVITNSYVEPPVSLPPAENLPQTGQLWWPVPLLLVGGLLLLVLGILRRRKSEKL